MKATLKWYNMVVDMPGMGPGAEKAGWWVLYLQELLQAGRYEDVFNYLAQARRTGALTIIHEATIEYNRALLEGKRKQKEHKRRNSKTFPAVVTIQGNTVLVEAMAGKAKGKKEPYYQHNRLKA
jgi:hypothetical protein